jgi:hypothetical protein
MVEPSVTELFRCDTVTVVCKCGRKRAYHFDPPMQSAAEFTRWQKNPDSVTPCYCGAKTADYELKLAPTEKPA